MAAAAAATATGIVVPATAAVAAAPSSASAGPLPAALTGDPCSLEYAAALDALHGLGPKAREFCFPPTPPDAMYRPAGERSIYLCGNSLGLQPERTERYVVEELSKWRAHGVEGHVKTARPWWLIEQTVEGMTAAIVGALAHEVVAMNSLTVNLHLLMVPFYRPTATRYKILLEDHAFPSDTYAVKSQLLVHGRRPEDAMVTVAPRDGEQLLRTDDIVAAIGAAGESLALVLLPGVQYYTGQLLDIAAITAAAHRVGAIAGWDLAHAVGNVPLRLHDWDVDFAAWCSYKYLNSGPGGIAGAFLHERYAEEPIEARPFLAGWWGHHRESRFKMGSDFVPLRGAGKLQLSNPPVLQTASLRASLEVFVEAGGMEVLRAKSLALTGYLERLLQTEMEGEVAIITPSDPTQRGCQLSLVFTRPVRAIHAALEREGIVTDIREPHVMRVSPVHLYNTAGDVLEFVTTLKLVLAALPPIDEVGASAGSAGAGAGAGTGKA